MTLTESMPHSHVWIDLNDPPISRMPYSPVVGDHRWEMKVGVKYVCRICKMTVTPKANE